MTTNFKSFNYTSKYTRANKNNVHTRKPSSFSFCVHPFSLHSVDFSFLLTPQTHENTSVKEGKKFTTEFIKKKNTKSKDLYGRIPILLVGTRNTIYTPSPHEGPKGILFQISAPGWGTSLFLW